MYVEFTQPGRAIKWGKKGSQAKPMYRAWDAIRVRNKVNVTEILTKEKTEAVTKMKEGTRPE